MTQLEQVLDMHKNGKKLREIGEYFGFTREYARQLLLRVGVKKQLEQRVRNVRLAAEAVEMARNGATCEQIKEKVGTSGTKWARGKHKRICELCPTRFSMYRPSQKLCSKCSIRFGARWSYIKAGVKKHHPVMLNGLIRLARKWDVEASDGPSK